MNSKEKINFFGYMMSRREIRFNGILFILLEVMYNVLNFVSQIPYGFTKNPKLIENANIEGPGFFPIILFFIGYAIIHYSYFSGRNEIFIEKHGINKYFIIKLLFIFAIVLTSTLLQFIALFFTLLFLK